MPDLLWTRWEASILSGTPGCSITPQWPREEGCLSVQSAELNLESGQQKSAESSLRLMQKAG